MPSNLKVIQTNTFTRGVDTDTSDEYLANNQSRYWLNIDVLSSTDGEAGVVRNIMGNTMISTPLPVGVNKTIGVALDEETNRFYFAVWNSEGYHSWYRYDSVANTIDVVIQSRTDTNDIDIFKWPERTLILHANIIGNNLLYWTMEGQPPRKINIDKAMDKSDAGYGGVILEQFTRAYKRNSPTPPFAEYFTDTTKKFNRVYGYQFKFAVRYIYDDYEKSEVSDWSNVPNPDIELFQGTLGIPDRNNGINVTFPTGSDIVTAIEVLMQKTNPEGGTLPWVSVVVLDKDFYDISSDSNYTYRFYNDGAYVPVDPKYPIRNNSSLPRTPKCQEFTKNALMYANFPEGRAQVDIDVEWEVNYEDIFLDSGTEPELNSPSFTYTRTGQGTVNSGNGQWRWVTGTFIIGNDVKAGNKFEVTAVSTKGGQTKSMTFSVTAILGDTAVDIANKLASQMRQSTKFQPGIPPGGYVNSVTVDGLGNASFDVRITNNQGWSWWTIPSTMYVNPVNTITLKDNGQSVRIIKNGSSTKYGIVYRDYDGIKEATQSNDSLIVPIMTMNELGGIKQPIISLTIKHTPPEWAYWYSIVRTRDLVYSNYINMLIQEAIEIDTGTDSYYDLVVGSLFTYQQLHPNTIIRYEFKRGDRVRLMYTWDDVDSEFDVVTESKDFEVLSYQEVTTEDFPNEIKVDGTSVAETVAASSDNIGSYIVINDKERLIVGATDGVSYDLNDEYPVESGDVTYPSFQIINRRGVLRVKRDPDYPIQDFSVVEVYSPAVGDSDIDENQFFEFGMVFPIIDAGTPNAYHSGNVQDQSISQDAIVNISNGSAYVRNREMPTSNNAKNPEVLVGLIEDPNYSDFYVSNMTDDGKSNYLDQGQGEVWFDSRIRWSNNYIEDTRINGLNDFDNDAREDYNDKYGAIQRVLFSEDRLYVFKYLKTAWATVYARRVTETNDTGIIAASPRILPNMLTYFLWDGGVGGNPESVSRNGNNIVLVSTNSGVIARIGGDGVEPISKTYPLDSGTRRMLESAKKAGAFIISWYNRKSDIWEFTFEEHQNIIYDSGFTDAGWLSVKDPLPSGEITITVTTPPAHGSVSFASGIITYTPDTGYEGPDTYEYEVFVGGVSQGIVKDCMDVVYTAGPTVWIAEDEYCITVGGVRTGMKGWNTLVAYDSFNNTPTGETKPNIPSDPDYVAPVSDPVTCEPQEMALIFRTTSTDPSYVFSVSSSMPIAIEARNGDTVLSSTPESTTTAKELDLSGNTGTADVYVKYPFGEMDTVTSLIAPDSSITEVFVNDFTGINDINLNDNSVGNFDISSLDGLVSLVIKNTGRTSLPLANNVLLERIEIDDNAISSITISHIAPLRVLSALRVPLTGIDFSSNTLLEGLFLSNNTIPQSDIQTGLDAVSSLTNLELQLMPSLITLDLNNNPDIWYLWLPGNINLESVAWGSLTSVRWLNMNTLPSWDSIMDVSGMSIDQEFWVTGSNITPAELDTILMDIDAMGLSADTPGRIIYGDFDTVTGTITPTSASLAAYNNLIGRGYTIIGPVPGT